MDLREKKTERSIKNAFLQLRSHKPLERITVKELTALAEISKATFYLHYRDIYDLSAHLQDEVIGSILNSVIQPDIPLLNTSRLTQSLFDAFCKHQEKISILFSDSQASVLPDRIEQTIKNYLFQTDPELFLDPELNVLLTYQIYGSYYAYWKNCKQFKTEQILEILDRMTARSKDVQKL